MAGRESVTTGTADRIQSSGQGHTRLTGVFSGAPQIGYNGILRMPKKRLA